MRPQKRFLLLMWGSFMGQSHISIVEPSVFRSSWAQSMCSSKIVFASVPTNLGIVENFASVADNRGKCRRFRSDTVVQASLFFHILSCFFLSSFSSVFVRFLFFLF